MNYNLYANICLALAALVFIAVFVALATSVPGLQWTRTFLPFGIIMLVAYGVFKIQSGKGK